MPPLPSRSQNPFIRRSISGPFSSPRPTHPPPLPPPPSPASAGRGQLDGPSLASSLLRPLPIRCGTPHRPSLQPSVSSSELSGRETPGDVFLQLACVDERCSLRNILRYVSQTIQIQLRQS